MRTPLLSAEKVGGYASQADRRGSAARIVTAERHGPYRAAEIDLARRILDDIPTGSLLLLDRDFVAYDFLWDLCACATVNVPVVFRSRTPERVEQELYGLLIAYNAVRKLMCDAASAAGVPAERLSFTAALERTREAAQDMSRMPTQHLPARYEQLLRSIARALVPERPGRSVPRVVKIKMSKFRLKRHLGPSRKAAA